MKTHPVETALYITKIEQLGHHDSKYTRLYFGNEFCQRLIPSPNELKYVLELASLHHMDFTFVTPYVTDEGLDRLDSLLQVIAEAKPGSEVVFNDWGVLQKINDKCNSLEPVMGRLLNKMKRGPRLLNFFSIVPRETTEYFQTCSLDVPVYSRFLLNKRVRRAELDNVLQGIGLNLNDTGMRGSLYIPYAYVTTTRLCLASGCEDHASEDQIGIVPCRRECQKYIFSLRHPVLPAPLISKGNTKFVKNEKIPDGLQAKGIDRIVYEPEIPL